MKTCKKYLGFNKQDTNGFIWFEDKTNKQVIQATGTAGRDKNIYLISVVPLSEFEAFKQKTKKAIEKKIEEIQIEISIAEKHESESATEATFWLHSWKCWIEKELKKEFGVE